MSSDILIAGLPRSGTTYLGSLLEAGGEIEVFQEPFNPEFGLRSVHSDFPFADGGGEGSLLAECAELRGSWKHMAVSRGQNRSVPRKAAKLVLGSETSWRWRQERLRRSIGNMSDRRVCFKDPYATFSAAAFAQQHGIRSIIMVRHPAAYALSYSAKPWKFGLGRLDGGRLVSKYLSDVEPSVLAEAETSSLVYCALMWKMMARHMTEIEEETRVRVIRHEDLSIDGETVLGDVCNHFDLAFTDSMRSYLERSSSGDLVGPQEQVHSFIRDSSKVVDHWRGEMPETDQDLIAGVVSDDLGRFYDAW